MVYGPTGNRVAWLPLYNLNCKARNTPVDKTGVNFSCCSQGVLRTVDAQPLLSRLNRALESIRCCEKEPCEIQTGSGAGSEGAPSGSDSPGETRWIQPLNPIA